jgi:ABC-type uncharacterized transport system involved in gliding motility auxiliary subunit
MTGGAGRFGRPIVIVLAAMALAVGIEIVAARTSRVVDLTAERSASLTEQTVAIAAGVDQTTTVTAFLRPDDPERAPAAALLLRYQRLNSRIRFRLLDPARAVGEQRRFGIDPGLGGVAVARGRVVEVVPTITEQDITGALARLERGRSATVCFTTGHGEAAVSDDGPEGLSRAGALLEGNGYTVRTIDLLASPEVPAGCTGLVVANPVARLGDAAPVLAAWLEADGRLLVLTDPISDVDVSEVVQGLGLSTRRGIVLEGDPAAARPDDPTSPIVRSYSSSHPIVRRLPPTFFPGLQQVVDGASAPEDGLVVSRLAQTSPLSYLETEPLTSAFDPATDAGGPIAVAVAAERSRLEPGAVRRSRAVVVGDVDFASNAVVEQAGNSTFLVRSLDWLTLDDQLVVLSANLPKDRTIVLTRDRVTYARFVSLALLPGLFLLTGAVVWAVRRGR